MTYSQVELVECHLFSYNIKYYCKRYGNGELMVIGILIILISATLYTSAKWALSYFGLSCFEQIIFHLKVPLEGTNTDFIFDWIKKCFVKACIFTAILCAPLLIETYAENFTIIAIVAGIILLILAAHEVGLFMFVINLFRKSNFYEDNYVDTKSVELTFPEKKRNLIYIYVESLETTYTSKENGGNHKHDLIYPLSTYGLEHINFSHNQQLGGAKVVSGTGWTTGGIVAQSAGIPLLVPISQKRFSNKTDFFPGIYALGDILEDQGYNQEYLIGSDAIFGGREFYFKKHGNYKIFDLKSAYKDSKIPADYKEFWGYEDEKLFAFAKEEVTALAKEDKPFNFTMLTVDTHHPYGYKCHKCEDQYDERLSNIIACNCKQVGEFVEWIQQQPFYENTTIVITGDHLSMAAEYINDTYDKNYERTIFNSFINSPVEAQKMKDRQFTSFDMFPTTLASMGVRMDTNQLGLGVNLFSEQETLLEKYGFDYMDQQLRKQSKLYKQKLLKK